MSRAWTNRSGRWAMAALAGAGLLAVLGCGPESLSRLNAPPQGWTARQSAAQEHFVYMVDSALLAEMCVTDTQFVPHQDVLNGMGARRLDRYAALLKETGGIIRYDTALEDRALVNARLESVRKYLEAAGGGEGIKVEAGSTTVAGMSAGEAVMARQNLAVRKAGDKDSGRMSGAGATNGKK